MNETNSHPTSSITLAPLGAPSKRGKGEFTVSFVIAACQRWWRWALPLGIVIAAAAAAPIYYFFEPQYEAVAYLEMRKSSPGVLETNKLDRDAVNTHVQMILSPRVLRMVLADEEVRKQREFRSRSGKQGSKSEMSMSEMASTLAKRLQVRSQAGSELYTVIYRGTSAGGAAIVANKVVDTYLNVQKDVVGKETQRVLALLQEERRKREVEVKALRERYKTMSQQLTGKDPYASGNQLEDNGSLEVPLLYRLQLQLIDLELEKILAESQIKAAEHWAAEAGKKSEVPASLIDQVVAEDLQVQMLEARILQGRQLLADLERAAREGAKSERYKSKLKEIEAQEKELASIKSIVAAKAKAEMQNYDALRRKEHVDNLKSSAAGNAAVYDSVKQRFDEELEKQREFTGESFDLAVLRGEVQRSEEIFNRVEDKIESIETEAPAALPVQPWDIALAPAGPIEEWPLKQMMLAIAVGMCAPFGVALAWEYLHQRITSAAQFTQHTNVPVISEIASLPTRAIGGSRRKTTMRLQTGIRCFRESIDALRTALMLTESLNNLQLIAVTSAISEEGKTSVASQLAVSLARTSGRPTLLIDGDVRSPDLHEIYEFDIGPGLTDVLEGKCKLSDAIVYHEACKLYLLPAGELTVNPHSLFGTRDFAKLIAEAREQFGYIVLDTPPVLPASEALVQAKFADACVVCARVDHSRTSQVAIAHDRLSRAGVRIAGAALVGVPMTTYYRRYGGYYYGK